MTSANYKTCLMRRYIYGYQIIDDEYSKMILELLNKIEKIRDYNDLIKELKYYLGKYNIITKTAYEELLARYLTRRSRRQTTIQAVQDIIDTYYTNEKYTTT